MNKVQQSISMIIHYDFFNLKIEILYLSLIRLNLCLKETDEDIYDTVQLDNIAIDPEHIETDIIIKEYSSRKPSFKTDINLDSILPVKENTLGENVTIDSILKEKEEKLFPRGPFGDLLKQKSLKSEASNDLKLTSDEDMESAEKDVINETVDIQIEFKKDDLEEDEILDDFEKITDVETAKTPVEKGYRIYLSLFFLFLVSRSQSI